MDTVYSKRLNEIKREKKFLERTLKIKISIEGRKISFEGNPLNEYEASLVFDAINMGFSARTATLISDSDFVYEKLNIKHFTKKRNLELIRGRIIGTHGKTKNTLEQISGCVIKIKDSEIGIIGPAEKIQYAITAITNIIKGTKQNNAYKYLERINTEKKKLRKDNPEEFI